MSILLRFWSTPLCCFPPRRVEADPQRVRALAEVFRRQGRASTVFNVVELPGPAWRGCFELRDASQVDELEATVEARLASVGLRLMLGE